MKIELTSFVDAGDLENERIGFKVKQSCNLKFFAVYHTSKTQSGFYNRPKHVLWFYPKAVQAGDEIVLYTKRGEDTIETVSDHNIHFLHWRLDESIMQEGDCVVLSEINDWSVTSFSEKE